MLRADQVKQAIELYLQRSYTQCAVLIDGSWGVGKTYLLNQYIVPDIDNVRCFHISLYGLSTIVDIENEIYKCACLNEDLAAPVFSEREYFSTEMLKGASLGGVSYAVQFLVNRYRTDHADDATRLVLCFDDIERWVGDLNVCLSYINKVVEQERIKCIILGNLDALDDRGIQDISRAREKTIRHVYRFENPPESVIDIALQLVDFSSDRSRAFVRSIVEHNLPPLTDFLLKVNEKNIRTVCEALQLYDYIYVHNKAAFDRASGLSFTYFITLLSTLILLKKHFVHRKEKTELMDGDFNKNSGFDLLKRIGYFDDKAPQYMTDESRILLDTIFYRLDEISLRGVFSIIENGFYIPQDFNDSFVHWQAEQSYEQYLDKYSFYQLDDDEADTIVDRVIDAVFTEQSITNPATLLLLAERLLSDIRKDIVDLDYHSTAQRFAGLITTLYESNRMDTIELDYLEAQPDRYPNSKELLKLALNLNSEYIKAAMFAEQESFWDRLARDPGSFSQLLEQADITAFLKRIESAQAVLELLESLTNAQLYLLSAKLKDMIVSFTQVEQVKTHSDAAGLIAEAIHAEYQHRFGVRASNLKEIATMFAFLNDPN